MARRRTRDAFERIEHDMQRERVAALARIGGRLEELLAQLERIREQLDHLSGPARDRQIDRYAELRQQAQTYRWYLEVQREAVGLRRHTVLDRLYPIPAPLDFGARRPLAPRNRP